MNELARVARFEGKRTTVGDALRTMWKRAKTTDAYHDNYNWLSTHCKALSIGQRLQLWGELHLLKRSDKASIAAGYLSSASLTTKDLVKSPAIAKWVKTTLPLLDARPPFAIAPRMPPSRKAFAAAHDFCEAVSEDTPNRSKRLLSRASTR